MIYNCALKLNRERGKKSGRRSDVNVVSPEQVADRIRNVLPPERVVLSNDVRTKPLPRTIAKLKLKALVAGAAIVRKELTGA